MAPNVDGTSFSPPTEPFDSFTDVIDGAAGLEINNINQTSPIDFYVELCEYFTVFILFLFGGIELSIG